MHNPSGNAYNRFKNVISLVQPAEHFERFSKLEPIQNAQPKNPLRSYVRDPINVSDIDGAQPAKVRNYHAKQNLRLQIEDIEVRKKDYRKHMARLGQSIDYRLPVKKSELPRVVSKKPSEYIGVTIPNKLDLQEKQRNVKANYEAPAKKSASPISTYAKYMLLNNWNQVSYKKTNIDKILTFGDEPKRFSPTFQSHLQLGSDALEPSKALYNPTFQVFKSLNGLH